MTCQLLSSRFGPCDVDWYAKRGALVLACPRQDMTRLWPLPMVHPWFDDGDPVMGRRRQAGASNCARLPRLTIPLFTLILSAELLDKYDTPVLPQRRLNSLPKAH